MGSPHAEESGGGGHADASVSDHLTGDDSGDPDDSVANDDGGSSEIGTAAPELLKSKKGPRRGGVRIQWEKPVNRSAGHLTYLGCLMDAIEKAGLQREEVRGFKRDVKMMLPVVRRLITEAGGNGSDLHEKCLQNKLIRMYKAGVFTGGAKDTGVPIGDGRKRRRLDSLDDEYIPPAAVCGGPPGGPKRRAAEESGAPASNASPSAESAGGGKTRASPPDRAMPFRVVMRAPGLRPLRPQAPAAPGPAAPDPAAAVPMAPDPSAPGPVAADAAALNYVGPGSGSPRPLALDLRGPTRAAPEPEAPDRTAPAPTAPDAAAPDAAAPANAAPVPWVIQRAQAAAGRTILNTAGKPLLEVAAAGVHQETPDHDPDVGLAEEAAGAAAPDAASGRRPAASDGGVTGHLLLRWGMFDDVLEGAAAFLALLDQRFLESLAMSTGDAQQAATEEAAGAKEAAAAAEWAAVAAQERLRDALESCFGILRKKNEGKAHVSDGKEALKAPEREWAALTAALGKAFADADAATELDGKRQALVTNLQASYRCVVQSSAALKARLGGNDFTAEVPDLLTWAVMFMDRRPPEQRLEAAVRAAAEGYPIKAHVMQLLAPLPRLQEAAHNRDKAALRLAQQVVLAITRLQT